MTEWREAVTPTRIDPVRTEDPRTLKGNAVF